MSELYDTVESALMWGAVLFAVGIIIYLAFLQYLKAKHHRARRRHRARRAMRDRSLQRSPRGANPASPSAAQQSENL